MNCCVINDSCFLLWIVYFLFLRYFSISSWTCTCCLSWLVSAQYQLCNKDYSLTDKQILHQQHCLSHVNLFSVNSSLCSDSCVTYGPCDYQGMDLTSKVLEDMWKRIYHKLLIHLFQKSYSATHHSLVSSANLLRVIVRTLNKDNSGIYIHQWDLPLPNLLFSRLNSTNTLNLHLIISLHTGVTSPVQSRRPHGPD